MVSTSSTDGDADRTVEVVVGRIGKPHGVRGEVTVEVRTDEPERRFTAGAVLDVRRPHDVAAPVPVLTVRGVRWHQGVLLLTFEEVEGREAAEALRGCLLQTEVPADARPDDPEEFYAHQLAGLAAYDVDGRELGTVTRLVGGGAQDLLVVRTPDGRDALVPFVAALVPEVDLDGGRVVIADRPGLVTPLED
ncbi:ribosome maturation factor RimM [Nocardioides taihuensis]|uniref:Ribosome maturation factor RimM n=1 Tax=Nocardioides taihuensis TaxID=1835606 RepID=A0ABW0BQI9_9ACTN